MMARIFFVLCFCFGFSQTSFAAASAEYEILSREYKKVLTYVTSVTPDGQIGEHTNFKKVGNHEIIWDLAKNENGYSVIRIFNEHHDGTSNFMIAYYHANHIIRGKTVIRRFIGPTTGSGLRNDTVDVSTGEYLGFQGAQYPRISESDQDVVNFWGIEVLR